RRQIDVGETRALSGLAHFAPRAPDDLGRLPTADDGLAPGRQLLTGGQQCENVDAIDVEIGDCKITLDGCVHDNFSGRGMRLRMRRPSRSYLALARLVHSLLRSRSTTKRVLPSSMAARISPSVCAASRSSMHLSLTARPSASSGGMVANH